MGRRGPGPEGREGSDDCACAEGSDLSESDVSEDGGGAEEVGGTRNAPRESEMSIRVSSQVSAPKVLMRCRSILKDSRVGLSWNGLRTLTRIRAIIDAMLCKGFSVKDEQVGKGREICCTSMPVLDINCA